jgi:Ca2+-binding EF-hand superfamily protein
MQSASLLTLAFAANIVCAQQLAAPTFDGLDTDNSGALTKAEVAEFVKRFPAGPQGAPNVDDVFGRWDANKDGSVSKEEFASRPRAPGSGGGPPGGGGAQPE